MKTGFVPVMALAWIVAVTRVGFAEDPLDTLLREPPSGGETERSPESAEPDATVSRIRPPSKLVEEIVVTAARKRAERLQDVPVAVTAISREQLDRYAISDLSRIGQMTPQLTIVENSNGNGGTLAIRGIGSSSTTSGFDQAVSIYIDGIQYTRGNVLHQGYFDLGQVEVLKGPQALFFGKNNTAGVVSLTSADPGDELELLGRFGHETRAAETWGEAIGSTPITETLGARVALRYGHTRGFTENLAPATTDLSTGETIPEPRRHWPDGNELLGRGTIAWNPIAPLDVKIKIAGSLLDTTGATQRNEIIRCDAFDGQATLDSGENCKGDYKVRQNDVAPAIAATEPILDEEGGRLYSQYAAFNVATTANYDLGPALLTSVTGFASFDTQYLGDYDFGATSLIFAAEDVTNESFSEELRVLTNLDFPANFVLGAYYQKTNFDFRNLARLIPNPVDPTTGRYVTWDRYSATDGETFSGFGQVIWDVTDTIELTPGARFTHETKDSYAVHGYIHPATAAIFRPAGDRLTDRFSDDDLSPEIALAWRPVSFPDGSWEPDLTLYGAYKQGFKSGGFSNSAILRNTTTVDNARFDSESVSGFEGGIKSLWLDNAILVNAVGYSYEFEDLQVNFFDSGSVNFDVQNAASAKTTGGEIEFRWRPPVEGLRLHGSGSYNRARYGEFLSFCYAGQTSTDGCNLDENGQPATPGTHHDLSGTVRPQAPEWTGAIGFLWEKPIASLLGHRWLERVLFGIGTDLTYTDNTLLSSVGRRVIQDSHFRTDMTARIFDEAGLWELGFFGRNLTDEFVILEAVDSPLTGLVAGLPVGLVGDQVANVGTPRELGLQVTVRF